jgi:hypothetical protein
LAYFPLPRNDNELPEKLQMVIQFQRRHALPAVIWKILRSPTYLDSLLLTAMKLLKEMMDRPITAQPL